MPWNGASPNVYVRSDGTRTGATVYQQEEGAGIDIEAVNLDAVDQDAATALSLALLRDGSQLVSADIPFNTHKLREVAPATALTDAPNATQVQTGSIWDAGTFGGTATALTCTLAPAPTAIARGLTIRGIAGSSVTAAATLNPNAIGATAIRKKLASGLSAITGGEWVVGQFIEFICDGTYFVLSNKPEWQASASIASAATIDLATSTGEYVQITGSTGPVTSLGTLPAGTVRVLRFASTPTLTYNATSLILPGAASITAAAGDVATFISEGSGNWRCTCYQRASGSAIAAGQAYTIKTANYTAVAGDKLECDCTASAWTLQFPASPANTDLGITVKKIGSYDLTIDLQGKNILLVDGTVSSTNPTIQGTPGSDFNFAYRGTSAAGSTDLWTF